MKSALTQSADITVQEWIVQARFTLENTQCK